MKFYFLLFLFSGILAGCTVSYPNSVVKPSWQNQQPLETSLDVPPGLKIVSVDYDAELYTLASEGDTTEEGELGRGFIKVHAMDRNNGEHYLLIYESLGQRSQPIQVIRFQENN